MSASVVIKKLIYSQPDFVAHLESLLTVVDEGEESVDAVVSKILSTVRSEGDAAVLQYTNQFDRIQVDVLAKLELSKQRLKEAFDSIPSVQRDALLSAKERIETYHQHQRMESWSFTDKLGHVLSQKVSPLGKVGIYVPGGKASYPSSVLMNAIPAKVAGVSQIVMVVPAPDNVLNELVLAAAWLAGVDRVFTIGGAQAIAALAYGTETIPKVDKIVGPGNIYVATAKKQVFGQVGIDMLAGPSEILIYCDGKTNPDWIAMDMFSQAEHDEQAQAILISQDKLFLDAVQVSIEQLLAKMQRADVIATSLRNRGAFILVNNDEQALDVINRVAPEHLELSLELSHAEKLIDAIHHAGAIFVGRESAETFGDYCAGSNHVLPTSGSARFSSPLSVYDFLKRTSLIRLDKNNLEPLIQSASTLAYAEGLQAHAMSAEFRRNLFEKND